MTLIICLDPCQWSLMSLITGNEVCKLKYSIKKLGGGGGGGGGGDPLYMVLVKSEL